MDLFYHVFVVAWIVHSRLVWVMDCVAWIVGLICCLVYDMDCLSWFLGCHVVACIVICCLMCVMDCDFVAWCTSWTVYHGFLAARLLHGL